MVRVDAEVEGSVYRLIRTFNVAWLLGSDGSSPGRPTSVSVYIDGKLQPDGVDSLKTLRRAQVREVARLNPRAAIARFGAGHSSGALLVTLASSSW